MISIVGCGPGGSDYVTQAAHRAVQDADIVLGSPRLLGMFDLGDKRTEELPPRSADAIRVIEQHLPARQLAVLVSGDPGLFSLGQAVVRHFGRNRCNVIPGISSVQAAFAAAGVDGCNARIISAHGRNPKVAVEDLASQDKIAVLAGTKAAMQWASSLAEHLVSSHQVFVCENLTLPDEHIDKMTAEQLSTHDASSLTVLLFVRSDLP